MNKLMMFLLVVAMTACGTKKGSSPKKPTAGLPEGLVLGASTNDDVEKKLGAPQTTYTMKETSTSSNSNNVTMYNYKDNKTFKFDGGVVKGFFRDPEEDEVHLQYWLQKWKDKKIKHEAVSESLDAHGKYESQLASEEDSTIVIYNKENGLVKRVMYYEK